MSKQQIEGSIFTTANMIFDSEWKPYKTKENTDLNTLSNMKSFLHTELLLEAMVLNAIVEEMMDENIQASITFSNDGSSMSGVGTYVVQSLTINGVQCALATLPIFTESRESLKRLQITTLKILSLRPVTKKTDFVMTDSTSHNLEVNGIVGKELQVGEIQKTLLCNVQPLLIFQAKMKKIWHDIHNSRENKKLLNTF